METLEETFNCKQQLYSQQELEDNFEKLSQEQLESQKQIEELEKELENQRAINEQKCEVTGNLEAELEVLRAEKDAVLDQISASQRNLEKKLEEKEKTELSLSETNELLKKLEKDKIDALEETANNKQQLSNQNIKLQELEDNLAKLVREQLESRKQIEALEKELENQRSINEEKCEVAGHLDASLIALESELKIVRADKEIALIQITESQRNFDKCLEEKKKTELSLNETLGLLRRLEKDRINSIFENEQESSKLLVESGIQCNYFSDLIQISNSGETENLPDGFPNLTLLRKENCRRTRADNRKLENESTIHISSMPKKMKVFHNETPSYSMILNKENESPGDGMMHECNFGGQQLTDFSSMQRQVLLSNESKIKIPIQNCGNGNSDKNNTESSAKGLPQKNVPFLRLGLSKRSKVRRPLHETLIWHDENYLSTSSSLPK